MIRSTIRGTEATTARSPRTTGSCVRYQILRFYAGQLLRSMDHRRPRAPGRYYQHTNFFQNDRLVSRTFIDVYKRLFVYFFFHPRDNDRSSLNCASMLKGGWWWKSCGRGLNGLYLNDPQDLTARQGKRERTWATQQSPADVSLGARKGRQDGPYAPLQSFNRHTHSDFSNALSYLIFGLILLCPPPLINWPRVPTLVSIVLLLRTVEPKRYGVSNRVTL